MALAGFILFLFVYPVAIAWVLMDLVHPLVGPDGTALLAWAIIASTRGIFNQFRPGSAEGTSTPFGLASWRAWELLPVSWSRLLAASAMAQAVTSLPALVYMAGVIAGLWAILDGHWLHLLVVLLAGVPVYWGEVSLEGATHLLLGSLFSEAALQEANSLMLGCTPLAVIATGWGIAGNGIGPLALRAHNSLGLAAVLLALHPAGWLLLAVARFSTSPVRATLIAVAAAGASVLIALGAAHLGAWLRLRAKAKGTRTEPESRALADRSGYLVGLARIHPPLPRSAGGLLLMLYLAGIVGVLIDKHTSAISAKTPLDVASHVMIVVCPYAIGSVMLFLLQREPGFHSLRLLPFSTYSQMTHLTGVAALWSCLIVIPGLVVVCALRGIGPDWMMIAVATGIAAFCLVESALALGILGLLIAPCSVSDTDHNPGIQLVCMFSVTFIAIGSAAILQVGDFHGRVTLAFLTALTLSVLWPAVRLRWTYLSDPGLDLDHRIVAAAAILTIPASIIAVGPAAVILSLCVIPRTLLQYEPGMLMFVGYLTLGGLTRLSSRRRQPETLTDTSRVSLPAQILFGLGLGLLSLCIAALCVGGLDWTGFGWRLGASAVEQIRGWCVSHPAALALIVTSVCLAAPIAEEYYFRGFLFRSLSRSWDNRALAAVVAALTFASLHLARAAPFALVFGLIATAALVRTRSLVPGMVAHGLHNSVLAGLFLWSLYTTASDPPHSALAAQATAIRDSPAAASGKTIDSRVPAHHAGALPGLRDPSASQWVAWGNALWEEHGVDLAGRCFEAAAQDDSLAPAVRLEVAIGLARARRTKPIGRLLRGDLGPDPGGIARRILRASCLWTGSEQPLARETLRRALEQVPLHSLRSGPLVELAFDGAAVLHDPALWPVIERAACPCAWDGPGWAITESVPDAWLLPELQGPRLAALHRDGTSNDFLTLSEMGLAILRNDPASVARRAKLLLEPWAPAPESTDPATTSTSSQTLTIAALHLAQRGDMDQARAMLQRSKRDGSSVAARALTWLEPENSRVHRSLAEPGRVLAIGKSLLLSRAAEESLRLGDTRTALELARAARAADEWGLPKRGLEYESLRAPVVEAQALALLGDPDPSRRLLTSVQPTSWPTYPDLKTLARPYQVWTYVTDLRSYAPSQLPFTGPAEVALILVTAHRVNEGHVRQARQILFASQWWSRRTGALLALLDCLDSVDGETLRRLENNYEECLFHPWACQALALLLKEQDLEVPDEVLVQANALDEDPRLSHLASGPTWSRQSLPSTCSPAEWLARGHFRRALEAARKKSPTPRPDPATLADPKERLRRYALADAWYHVLRRMRDEGEQCSTQDLVSASLDAIQARDIPLLRETLGKLAADTSVNTDQVANVLNASFGAGGEILDLPPLLALANQGDRVWRSRLASLEQRLVPHLTHPWLSVLASIAAAMVLLSVFALVAKHVTARHVISHV